VDYQGKNWKLKSNKTEPIAGLVPGLREVVQKSSSPRLEKYLSEVQCDVCEGARLRESSRHVFFRGKAIGELTAMPISELSQFFDGCDLSGNEKLIGGPILEEIASRLRFLNEVGLGYLGLERSAATLSGGESQRIRLATQVGSRLKGVLYLLDEPSIGLHARDNLRLIGTLLELRDLGNTVCVVEHDQETMERSDVIIDVGPAAGVHGGEIISAGSYSALLKNKKSETGAYLSGRKSIALPECRCRVSIRALYCGHRRVGVRKEFAHRRHPEEGAECGPAWREGASGRS
jgi:excinuclease ABC subunit A